MRVTFVARKLNLTGGGSDFSLELMARMLVERGFEVRVVTLDSSANSIPDPTSFDVVEANAAPIKNRLDLIKRAFRQLRRYTAETDLFHLFPPTALPGAGLYRLLGGSVPVVGRLNTHSAFCVNFARMDGVCHRNCTSLAKFRHDRSRLKRRLLKIPLFVSQTHLEPRLIRSVDRFFAISPVIKEMYSSIGLPSEDITVVPNFYDPAFDPDVDDARPSWSPPLRILYVGRLEPIKGVDVLLRSLKDVDDVTVDVVGVGSCRDDLESLAKSVGLQSAVHFHGWVDHDGLGPIYENADVFVHPGRWPEPFGRTVLEAMQYRTPPIVTNIGAPPWIVDDAGIVVEPEDSEALARALRSVEDRRQLQELQSKCDRRLSNFAPEAVLDTIASEYRSLV